MDRTVFPIQSNVPGWLELRLFFVHHSFHSGTVVQRLTQRTLKIAFFKISKMTLWVNHVKMVLRSYIFQTCCAKTFTHVLILLEGKEYAQPHSFWVLKSAYFFPEVMMKVSSKSCLLLVSGHSIPMKSFPFWRLDALRFLNRNLMETKNRNAKSAQTQDFSDV